MTVDAKTFGSEDELHSAVAQVLVFGNVKLLSLNVLRLSAGETEQRTFRQLSAMGAGTIEILEALDIDPVAYAAWHNREHSGKGRHLLERFRSGRVSEPLGVAIVSAVVDWARAGLSQRITEVQLHDCCRYYGANITRVDRRSFTAGLNWALAPISDSEAALIYRAPSPVPAYEPDPHIYRYLRAGSELKKEYDTRRIPDGVWDYILSNVPLTTAQLIDVGHSACTKRALDVSLRAFEMADSAGADPSYPDWDNSMFVRGYILGVMNRHEEALGIYTRLCTALRNPWLGEYEPIAAYCRAATLEQLGRLPEAVDAYRALISRLRDKGEVWNDLIWSYQAMAAALRQLGLALLRTGNRAAAADSFRDLIRLAAEPDADDEQVHGLVEEARRVYALLGS